MSPTIDPSKLKVTELREELQARGLDTKGNKPVLVKRLKKALEEELNKELPDTSIADTSTEDLDCSRTEEASINEAEPEPEPETESEQESKAVSETVPDQKEVEISPKENENDTTDATNIEASDIVEKRNGEEDSSKIEPTVNKQESKDDEEKEVSSEKNDVEMKEVSVESEDNQKGEKRKRSDDSPENAPKKKVFKITEDEPDIDSTKVLLSWYDSDLHLIVDKQSFLSAKPIHDGLFGYAWAGVRATHGINAGKVRYEVKITEEMIWEDFTNQRRERQEKAKERREKEKQKQKDQSKAEETEKTESKSEIHETNDINESCEKPKDEQMDVDDKSIEVVESENSNEENKTESVEETKMETQELKESSEDKDAENKVSESKDDKAPSESKEDENKVSSESKEEEIKDSSEVKVESEQQDNTEGSAKEVVEPTQPILTHIFRAGWSIGKTSLQLGEDKFSFGYESTGKFVSNKEFKDFAASYKLGDVVGAFLSISSENIEMRFTVNGELQPEVISVPRTELPEDDFALFPHVLSRNFGFELNLGNKEEAWFPSPEGLEDYSFLQAVEEKIVGPVRPEKREECEVIMMCGLPGSGKTHWVNEYLKANNDKSTNVIGSTHLLEKMTVHGQPLKSTYNGQWNILMEKLQRCLNRLGDIAAQRRRNYILDQTNVFPSAQHRKLRAFEGFKRRAVVVVVGDEEYTKRQSLKEAAVGKDVQDYTVMEMKANMSLPTLGDLCDEVIYTDLNEEEAKAKVSQYNTEGKAAVSQKRKYRDDNKNRYYNRAPYNRGGNYHDRGPPRYDRGPRSWSQLPPARNPRDRRPPPPPMSGGRDWMRNNRGSSRPAMDRNSRDSRPMNYNRNRNQGGGGRSNWQSGGNGYGQGGWGGQQGSWNSGNQGWGSSYQQQGNWNANSQNQWKYGGGNSQAYNQQGYGQQDWNNYYGQYPQNWSGQGQQSDGSSNQYAQWAQYAQQYAQGQNAKYTNATSKK